MTRYVVSAWLIVLLSIASLAYAEPPQNLALAKQDVVKYYLTGQYNHDVVHAIKEADVTLEGRVETNKALKKAKRLAIVFDIDDTSISNFAFMKKRDFGATPPVLVAMQTDVKNPAIKPVLELSREATEAGVTIFFVTGRMEKYRKTTEQLLKNDGYAKWAKLYMKPNNYIKKSVVPYKTSVRRLLKQKGYDVILNIGDQQSDLKGGYADQSIKMPNPMYLIP